MALAGRARPIAVRYDVGSVKKGLSKLQTQGVPVRAVLIATGY